MLKRTQQTFQSGRNKQKRSVRSKLGCVEKCLKRKSTLSLAVVLGDVAGLLTGI